LGSVSELKRIACELRGFNLIEPALDEVENMGDIEILVPGWVFRYIRLGQSKERRGGFKTFLLQMDEGAGELNEAFVKEIVRLTPLRQPQLLEDIVRLIKELLIKALEIPQIMRVHVLPAQTLNHGSDAGRFFAHGQKLNEE
jgi:hypothetical protein